MKVKGVIMKIIKAGYILEVEDQLLSIFLKQHARTSLFSIRERVRLACKAEFVKLPLAWKTMSNVTLDLKKRFPPSFENHPTCCLEVSLDPQATALNKMIP